MIPAYALFRRSTTQQDLSIKEQRAAVRAWAEVNGYQIVREFADDASGLDTKRRREILRLMELCTAPGRREADTVLCYDVSRFSRLDPTRLGSTGSTSGEPVSACCSPTSPAPTKPASPGSS